MHIDHYQLSQHGHLTFRSHSFHPFSLLTCLLSLLLWPLKRSAVQRHLIAAIARPCRLCPLLVSVMSQFSSFSRPGSSSSAVRKPYEESKEAVSFAPSSTSTIHNIPAHNPTEPASSHTATMFKQRAIYSQFITTQPQQQPPQSASRSHHYEHKEQYSTDPSYVFSAASFPASVHPSPPLPLSLFHGHKLPSLPPLPQHSAAPTRLQPTVIVPFEHQSANLPPRRIAIERKKRQYAAQSLSALLAVYGINYSQYSPQHDHESGLPSYLLLQLFDDVEYETYTPEQWLQYGPIEGRSLRLDASGHGDYVPCTVLEYGSARDEWRVQFDDSGVSSWTCRLHLYMAVEDPQLYVARVANAHKQRRGAEAALRCALYVDCMPIDDLSGMDAEQVNRILFLSLNTKKMRVNNNDTTQLINEIQLDYSRTINALIYNAHQPTNATKALTTAGSAVSCPDYATVRIPAHDFASHFTSFCFHSFMTKPEAIVSLIRVNAECQKLNKTPLLLAGYSKPVRVDEFSGSQHATISGLQSYLHDKLLVNVTAAIRQGLKDVDKGWLNLHEKSRELYDFSKLKRLMTRINFMIGDAVRACALQAMTDYVALIERTCQYEVAVQGLKDAQLTLRGSAEAGGGSGGGASGGGGEAPSSGQPLFSVDLLFKDGCIQYSSAATALATTPLDVFDAAFAALSRLPQIESSCLPQLFPANNVTHLAAVQREEPIVDQHAQRLTQLLQTAIQPLTAYLSLYDTYLPFLQLNLDDWIKELQRSGADTLDQLRRLIAQHVDERSAAEAAIPKQLSLGLALVNCDDVRRKLNNKHTEAVTKLLDAMQRNTQTRCEDITRHVKKVETDIKRTPIDIVELTRLREYLVGVPSLVNVVRSNVWNDVMPWFDMLDTFSCRMAKHLYKLKYTLIGYPKALMEMLQAREAQLANDTTLFLQEMRSQQDELINDINECEKQINHLSHLHDFEHMDRVNDKCEKIAAQLIAIQQRANQFNSNELLFPSTSSTDYTIVHTLQQRFDDYYRLFTTAYQWTSSVKTWRYGAFVELDGGRIVSEVERHAATMAAVLQSRTIVDNAAHQTLAVSIEKEIGAFKLVLPLVVALRNAGMKERHWQQLSAELPFNFSVMMRDTNAAAAAAGAGAGETAGGVGGDDGQPSSGLTLQRLCDEYGLHKNVELIQRVSSVASEEFAIESSLQRMDDEWKARDFTVTPFEHSGSFVVQATDDIRQLLATHIDTTRAMLDSSYKQPFEERLTRWLGKLTTVSGVIDEWLAVQARWTVLQAVFASADVCKALVGETKRFMAVNKSWRLMMAHVHATPDVLSFADNAALLAKFRDNNATLTSLLHELHQQAAGNEQLRALLPAPEQQAAEAEAEAEVAPEAEVEAKAEAEAEVQQPQAEPAAAETETEQPAAQQEQ